MSIEQRKQVMDVFKVILWISISISSFLLVNNYQSMNREIEKTHDKLQNIEHRIIRMEYELKLK